MSEQKQLWSDQDLYDSSFSARGYGYGDAIPMHIARQMRDAYEAELAQVRDELGELQDVRAQNAMLCAEIRLVQERVRELEAAREWEPVEDSTTYCEQFFRLVVFDGGKRLGIWYDDYGSSILLPPNVRLMRRRPQVQP